LSREYDCRGKAQQARADRCGHGAIKTASRT
jgi:hypothetical protein